MNMNLSFWNARRLALAGMIASAVVILPEIVDARPINEIRKVSATGLVNVEAVSVDLEVVAGKSSQVSVVGELPEGWSLDIDASGSRTKIKIRPSKSNGGRPDAQLKITVPKAAPVEIMSVSSDLKVRDIGNRLHVSTVSGDVNGSVKADEVEIKSVSGDVDLQLVSSRTSVRSVSGDIKLEGSKGVLTMKSVSGDIVVANGNISRSEIASTSGDIRYIGGLAPTGPHSFKSHSGDIDLKVPKGNAMEISAQSFSGDVEDGFSSRRYEGRSKSNFSVGKGGPSVKLRTFSGDIVVRPR